MRRFLIFSLAAILVAVGIVSAVAQRPAPPRRPPPPGRRPPPLAPERAAPLAVDAVPPRRSEADDRQASRGLIQNADLEIAQDGASTVAQSPRGFEMDGDCLYSYLGNPATDRTGWGVRFVSGQDVNGDGARQGRLTQTVRGLKAEDGRWFRLRIRGLAQGNFSSASKQLFLKAEFFAADGQNPLDSVSRNIYGTIEELRRQSPSGETGPLASVIWRTHGMEFRTPFPEVDTLRLSVGFGDGDGAGEYTEFLIDEFDLQGIPDPAEYVAATSAPPGQRPQPPALAELTPLGGHWYYDPRGLSGPPPKQFDHANADRLYYLTDRLELPFAENMSAWLRKGYLDRQGKLVPEDRFVPDNVVLSFDDGCLVIRSHNLPNHPTAVFPDVSRVLDGSPNYLREMDQTFYIPLEPRENPKHRAMTSAAQRHVMNPGAIGVAINGVVFFDPYDAEATEAFWRLDRCCGHPSPRQQYHYHKYPVCVKTPWVDNGESHSPLIGFAFDGFPVFGPYESPGVMAKDSSDNPLNEFNLHADEFRGPHYHVTPGKFPHILGGYWGTVDPRNLPNRTRAGR
ncbi:MAG: YHYH protein [Pirellulales bacterium]